VSKTAINPNQEYIYGLHPIRELLRAKKRKLLVLYTTQPTPKAFNEIKSLLPGTVVIKYTTRDALTRLAQTPDHQGFVGITTPFITQKKPFAPKTHPFILLLDSIQDVGNMGAILRTAYCTGITGVVIPQKGNAPMNADALKASAGLAEHLAIYEAPSAIHAAQELKKEGYTLYCAALGGKNALDVEYKQPLCLVIGNEATGIAPQILKEGVTVMLSQREPTISYNASVAAGILLFTIATRIQVLK
jgi:23S rRNA (guanosine2251-2'-O)-methyltransferase